MNGVREVDEGHKFCFGFSLLKTRSPKLRWQALHHTDNHFIFFVCNGLIVFGRLITTISSSKVLECKDFFFVCESCQLTWTLFLSYVRLLCPFNASKKEIKMYYGSNTINFLFNFGIIDRTHTYVKIKLHTSFTAIKIEMFNIKLRTVVNHPNSSFNVVCSCNNTPNLCCNLVNVKRCSFLS